MLCVLTHHLSNLSDASLFSLLGDNRGNIATNIVFYLMRYILRDMSTTSNEYSALTEVMTSASMTGKVCVMRLWQTWGGGGGEVDHCPLHGLYHVHKQSHYHQVLVL